MIGFRRKKLPELAGKCGQPESVSTVAVQVSHLLTVVQGGRVHQEGGTF
jgi:hypothetical protein